MGVLEGALAGESPMLDGDTAFKLYDTYGFPVDLTADICRERGIQIDFAGFEAAMDAQRERARAAFEIPDGGRPGILRRQDRIQGLRQPGAEGPCVALYRDGAQVQALNAGESGVVVLDRTPFYAESGGQCGDSGDLRNATSRFVVEDTQKIQADVFGHHGKLEDRQAARSATTVAAQVDSRWRAHARPGTTRPPT